MDLEKIAFDRVIERRGTGSAKWDLAEPDLLPLWIADMDFEAPAAVREALIERARHGIFGYGAPAPSCDEAIAAWLERRQGWAVDGEQFCFCPGVIPAVSALIRLFTLPGEGVILQTPVYYPFYECVTRNGRHIVENPLVFDGSRYAMDFDDLEQKAADPRTTAVILCSPHNPVGRVWTEEELRRFGEICLRHGLFVIADEIHGDLVYRPNRQIPFASLDEAFAASSATCVAPSKTFNLAGLQFSTIIIADRQKRERFRNELMALGLKRPNVFAQAAAEAAYRHGEAWLEALLEYLEGNIAFVEDFLARHLPQLRLIRPEGTYLAWIDCRALGLSAQELEGLMLHNAKVWLDEGHIFGPAGAGFERVVLACPRPILEEALKRIEKAVNSLSR
jgi:cystathionine beta-lyase